MQAKRDKETAAKLEAAKALTFLEAASSSWRRIPDGEIRSIVSSGGPRSWARLASRRDRAINDLPVGSIDTALALKVLEPIWKRTPETASRVRQRCEAVIAWATARGFREGPNCFAWKNHLDHLLPQPKKVRAVKHHPALPYTEIGAFMAELRANASISSLACSSPS